jgi:hypothetical protein
VLLGDSIFDNAAYVPGEDPVIEQLRKELPSTWRASLLAVDGNVTSDVAFQLRKLPDDATHLVLSVGGNDALGAIERLNAPSSSVLKPLTNLAELRESFLNRYVDCVENLLAQNKPLLVSTIYDCVPNLSSELKTALCLYNDVILRTAVAHGLPVLDLRRTCSKFEDYSPLSPIEPSSIGGQKIALAISKALLTYEFSSGHCRVYS